LVNSRGLLCLRGGIAAAAKKTCENAVLLPADPAFDLMKDAKKSSA
jgi:hypothetical protein